MKLFQCQNCGLMAYFENETCARCGVRLGFEPETMTLLALNPDGNVWRPVGADATTYRFCVNATHGVCNWVVRASDPRERCVACQLNRTIPDLSIAANRLHWLKIETDKRRLVYSLLKLGLPFETVEAGDKQRLSFDFLADTDPNAPVMTGHASGLVTINIAEADDVERETRRSAMGEPYRTLLGHFRHETGHFYWNMLVRDGGCTADFRALFGDESPDYGEALAAYYRDGPSPDWRGRHVSAYASAHPWEDFAETWAHYLHIVDTLETAGAFGMQINPTEVYDDSLRAIVGFDPYEAVDFNQIVEAWLPLTFAVNSLNRSMGQPDLYPFVLAPPAIEKLAFVHRLVHGRAA